MPADRKNIPRELTSPSDEFLSASERFRLFWWYWDHINRKITMSPTLIEILGLTPDTFDQSPESMYKNIHPEDVVRNVERMSQVIKGETELYEMEYRIRDSEGRWQWYYNRGTAMYGEDGGEPVGVGGITMDISGPFKQLLSRVEEKEKFEFIFRNTNEAIAVIELLEGKAGNVVDANNAALNLFNKGPEVIGKPLPDEILQDKVIGKDGVLMKDVFEKGFGRIERKLKIGDIFVWLEISVHAFTMTGENLIIAILKNKTPERMTEAALRESERLYRTLVEAADDAIGLFTVDYEIILINSAIHTNFGYSREEFMEMPGIGIVHPEDVELLNNQLGKLLQDGSLSMDFRVIHKSGECLHVSSKNVLIRGESGEKDLILTIIRDVTERRKEMEELELAKERAEESDKLKSAFLANMSHEIRTPMNSIIGFSNLLNNIDMENDVMELYVNRIVNNSELLLTLISDIIDLAKIESGQVSMNYGRLSLFELINELKQHAYDEAERLQKENLEITSVVEVDNCEMETDVLRITQVMKNLINNAIKFTPEGSVEIGCRMGETGQTVVLYVKDTGIGIEPEHFEVIFDQFRQIDGSNTRKFGGTGLGQAISKYLVTMMGGMIWVEAEPGSGSVLQVELPLMSFGIKKQHQPPVDQVSVARESKLEISVLAVDDEPDALELYQAMLNGMGHSVRTAGNGYEALRMLEQFPLPDLVLMDVQMPVLSGTDTLKIIRERYPGVKVVAQSAHALVGDRDRFLKEGYDDYLPKPFTTEQMDKVISNHRGK